ncbi:MAG TPA: LamG-like jellyroll fold domain-containing protein, partial [Solirubrobacteraceae bacterium]|nr:LamG-like jellyroll fold domain-containing protein [Solirubrobacteraceae bacterium]
MLIGLFAWSGAAGGTQPYETYESTVAGDAPVAQFRFDDAIGASTLADSAGSYTATNSGITLGGEGPFGGSKSGSFGGESYAALPSNPLAGVSAFTAEAWVDWAGGSSYEQPIFDFGSSATNYMSLTPAGGTKHLLLFEIRTSSSTDVQVTATKLSASKWQYVAVTETSSGMLTLYVDGEQVGQTTGVSLSPASLATATGSYLGKSQSATAPLFHGSLSNVAFYNTALSASKIQAHYDAGEFPTATAPPTISGTATDGQTLTAKGGTWSGLTPITLSYQWTLCNVSGASCSNIPAATETKYKISHEDVGQTLRVAVTATNGAGTGTATSAQTTIVAALKPSNTTLPVISGMAEVGQLLPVSTGTWEGSPPLTYTYQWETCNSSGKSCKAISGANASSYRVISSEIGDTLRAIVTATNSGGSVGATSEATATVTTGPPANTALPAISGTARDGQTLSASSGSWAGTEPITYSYQWQSCNSSGEACSNISGATGSTHGLGSSDVGSTMRVVVTAKNSVGSTNATSPPSPVVAANAPSNTAAPTISGTATDGQTLSAGTGSWSGSTPLSYAYQWESCNSSGEACANISGATGSTYTLGHSDVGTRLRVVVTASNSGGSASSTSAKTATVAALAPSNTAAPTISGTATDGQTLTATTGEWAGTPSFTFSYQWQRCNAAGEACADISGATGSTYTLVHADAGHAVRVAVSAENAAGSSTQRSAPSGEVLPLAPSNTARPEVTGTAKQGQTLTASTGSWSGTPAFNYGYQWQDCNTLGESCFDIAGATASTYVPAHSDVGSTLRVAVTATNAAGSNTSDSDPTPTVIESSCTDTWVGASEGSWQTAANWSNDAVPDSEDVACIEAGTTVQIGSGSNQAAAVKDAGA